MSAGSESKDPDDVLTGTTMRVYRFLISEDRPVSAREVQKSLNLSSPALAIYHLDKLAKIGIVGKYPGGDYVVEKMYLKHYIRLRSFLIPRYFFYATLSTFFIAGWVVLLVIPSSSIGGDFWLGLASKYGFTLVAFLTYGLVTNTLAAIFFWFETVRVFRHDKI